jgi:hypothetical protein
MTVVHRPLSDWVASLSPRDASAGAINHGAERTDARKSTRFTRGWIRRRASVAHDDATVYALALYNPASGETVIELDGYGSPVEVSEPGIDVVDHIENDWPDPQLNAEQLDTLRAEPAELCYLVLSRLTEEGNPGPDIFHVLPWSRVDNVIDFLLGCLERSDNFPTARDTKMHHWFTPAVTGVIGPLEQLRYALVNGDRNGVRIGSTALCDGLRRAVVARLPVGTAERLALLVEALASDNPFLGHAARIAAARLRGSSVQGFSVSLSSDLPSAASATSARVITEELIDGSKLSLSIRISEGGKLRITAGFGVPSGEQRELLLQSYGAVFLPVTIQSDDGRTEYWIALEVRQRGLSGTIELPAPRGRFQVTADSAPSGVHELRLVEPDALHPSLIVDNARLRVWRDQATGLPATHPIRLAIENLGGRAWS